MINHIVLFWLRKNLTADEISFFESHLKSLKQIPTVSTYNCGGPSNTPERSTIDHSYDYALNLLLENMEAHDLYQEDPIHKDFIKQCSPLWTKVLIYDFDSSI